MPGNTTEILTAGIEFKIGDTKIDACYSTPDMGSEPERVDVTSFDDTEFKRYIEGLQDVQSLNFDFYNKTTNYTAAKTNQGTAGTTYTVTYPSGVTYTITGSHRVFMLSASTNDAEKFRIAITVSSISES